MRDKSPDSAGCAGGEEPGPDSLIPDFSVLWPLRGPFVLCAPYCHTKPRQAHGSRAQPLSRRVYPPPPPPATHPPQLGKVHQRGAVRSVVTQVARVINH